MIGTSLNHYRITKALGSGGMGEVYLAEDTRLKRLVALKILPASLADADRRERFEREAQAIAALNHPNIVTVYSVEQAGDTHFITMEYVDGRTLADIIPKGGLSLKRLLGMAVQTSEAVAAAHVRGIVHRDLKPANVMVTAGDRVKVLDFGLAKLREATEEAVGVTATRDLTGEGKSVGTVAYMSPEQAEGKTVDGRTDIFSLGVLLYEMTVLWPVVSGWSPDGQLLAIGTVGDRVGSIWVYTRETRTYRRIADGGGGIWLRDGRRLIYANRGRLFVADTTTKQRHEVLSLPGEVLTSPRLANDDSQLFFTRLSTPGDIWLMRFQEKPDKKQQVRVAIVRRAA